MKTTITLSDLQKSACATRKENQHLWEKQTHLSRTDKKQKYNNVIIEFDGFSFRSKKECARYVTLRAKQSLGEIKDLQLQIPFELNPNGTHSLKYVADFLYIEVKTGQHVVDDTKGKETQLFKKKAKLMLELFGITVRKS